MIFLQFSITIIFIVTSRFTGIKKCVFDVCFREENKKKGSGQGRRKKEKQKHVEGKGKNKKMYIA